MGLFGTLIGWDQQKDAHNAVLASHLVETASPRVKQNIARSLVRIQRTVAHKSGSDKDILCKLSELSRIKQMNFCCHSLP